MSGGSGQKILLGLMAAAALGATALIALNVYAHGEKAVGNEDGAELRGGPVVQDNTLPVLVSLPDFSLVERSGKPVGRADLAGKIWIGSFIFTHCAGPCPLISAQMAGLQKRLAAAPGWDRVRLVSFSVDPERDTPEVLREYAGRFGADAEHWLMLTGEKKAMWPLIRDGFKLAVGDAADETDMPIMHSTKFVLVDAAGRVRGYYDGLESEGRERLVRDASRLLDEPAGPGRR